MLQSCFAKKTSHDMHNALIDYVIVTFVVLVRQFCRSLKWEGGYVDVNILCGKEEIVYPNSCLGRSS